MTPCAFREPDVLPGGRLQPVHRIVAGFPPAPAVPGLAPGLPHPFATRTILTYGIPRTGATPGVRRAGPSRVDTRGWNASAPAGDPHGGARRGREGTSSVTHRVTHATRPDSLLRGQVLNLGVRLQEESNCECQTQASSERGPPEPLPPRRLSKEAVLAPPPPPTSNHTPRALAEDCPRHRGRPTPLCARRR